MYAHLRGFGISACMALKVVLNFSQRSHWPVQCGDMVMVMRRIARRRMYLTAYLPLMACVHDCRPV